MKRSRSELKYLHGFIGPYRGRRARLTLLCAVEIIVSTFIPFLLGRLTTMVERGEPFHKIVQFGLFLFAVGLTDMLLNVWQNYTWHTFVIDYSNYFQYKMLEGAFSLSPASIKEKEEDIHSRILNDGSQVASHIGIGYPMLILNLLKIALVIGIMFSMSVRLACVMLVVVPIYTVFFKMTNKRSRENSKREREALADINGKIKETLRGFFQIKIFQKESFFLQSFKKQIEKYNIFAKNIRLYTAFSYGIGQIMTVILPILILILGAYEASQGRMEIGSLFSFYFYLSFLYEPLNNLADYFSGLQLTLGMSHRVTELIDPELNQENETEADASISIDSIDCIDFSNVSFSYEDQNPILENFNFEARKGDVVGVIGPSGSGKSTLLAILLKILENYEGEVLVNGIDLHKISRDSYYEQISYLGQDPLIFSGVLKENIMFDQCDETRYYEATKRACVDTIHEDHSEDEFVIDIGGENLSGGEKQRVALARALYKNFDLLILDEFTSALDKKTEAEVISNLRSLPGEDTIVFLVTHRPQPLSLCNKVIDLG